MHRILSAAVAAVVATGGASSTDASVCRPHPAGNTWYAVMGRDNTSRAEHGAAINIDTTALSTGSPASEFVDHEMWYSVNAACNYWVEVGVTDGYNQATGTVVHHAVFWADNRANGGGYHEHYPNVSWNLGAYYQVKVVWAGNNSWNSYFGGVFLGRSMSNYYGGVGRCLLAGLESTRAAATDHVGGHMFGWARKARNDVWYQDWDGKYLWSYCPADIDVSSNNVTTEVLHGPN
jgi:hypothetical protein